MDALHSIDTALTEAIFNAAASDSPPGHLFDAAVVYLGLIPYELYVLPGMMVAIMYAMFKDHAASLRFHVLPHVTAFSIVGLLKAVVRRGRPGCYGPEGMVRDFEMAAKCKRDGAGIPPWSKRKGFGTVSFPSGHACVAWSVMMGLVLYLTDENQSKWSAEESKEVLRAVGLACLAFAAAMFVVAMAKGRKLRPSALAFAYMAAIAAFFVVVGTYGDGIDFNETVPQTVVIALGVTVAMFVSLHRIAKGYHHLFDSIAGAILGAAIGMTVYTMWPEPTGLDPAGWKLAVDGGKGPAKYLIGSFAVVYCGYFFAMEMNCIDEGGCDLRALAKQEH